MFHVPSEEAEPLRPDPRSVDDCLCDLFAMRSSPRLGSFSPLVPDFFPITPKQLCHFHPVQSVVNPGAIHSPTQELQPHHSYPFQPRSASSAPINVQRLLNPLPMESNTQRSVIWPQSELRSHLSPLFHPYEPRSAPSTAVSLHHQPFRLSGTNHANPAVPRSSSRRPIENFHPPTLDSSPFASRSDQTLNQEAALLTRQSRLARGVLMSDGKLVPVREGDLFLPDSESLSLSGVCSNPTGPKKNSGGRPRKNAEELGRTATYDRISVDLAKLKEFMKTLKCKVIIRASVCSGDVTRHVQIKSGNGDAEIEETEDLGVLRDAAGEITDVLDRPERSVFYRQKLHRTALWKVQHNISDHKLSEILGFNRGINYMVKAHAVIKYLESISRDIQETIRLIPIQATVNNKLVTGVVVDPVSLVHYAVCFEQYRSFLTRRNSACNPR